jgi:hypothetical protein
LREEGRLRVSENRMLRRIFGSDRDEYEGSGEDYITRNFIHYSSPNIIRLKTEIGRTCGTYGARRVHTGL